MCPPTETPTQTSTLNGREEQWALPTVWEAVWERARMRVHALVCVGGWAGTRSRRWSCQQACLSGLRLQWSIPPPARLQHSSTPSECVRRVARRRWHAACEKQRRADEAEVGSAGRRRTPQISLMHLGELIYQKAHFSLVYPLACDMCVVISFWHPRVCVSGVCVCVCGVCVCVCVWCVCVCVWVYCNS